jgi:hypothetical protein
MRMYALATILFGGIVGAGVATVAWKITSQRGPQVAAQAPVAAPTDGSVVVAVWPVWSESGTNPAAPRWSLDGRMLAFEVPRAFGSIKLYAADVQADGRAVANAVAPDGSGNIRLRLMQRPVWGNGALLFEGQKERSPVRRIFQTTIGGAAATELIDADTIDGDLEDASIDATNNRVLVVRSKLAASDLFWWDRKTNKAKPIDLPGIKHFPTWSPDGKTVVFGREVDGDDDVVRLDPAKPNKVTVVAGGPGDQIAPVVLPDDRVVYVTSPDGRPWEVAITDGTTPRTLAQGVRVVEGWRPGVSPDGRWLAWVDASAPDLVQLTPIDGGATVKVRPGVTDCNEPTVSVVDGHVRVAFLAGPLNGRGVYVADVTDALASHPPSPTALADSPQKPR